MRFRLMVSACALMLSWGAQAGLPGFNVECPGKLDVHADDGGPVYINGKETKFKKLSETYFEAKGSGVTLSIMVNPDESVSVSYSGKHGVNGVCSLAEQGTSSHEDGSPEGVAKRACIDAVASTTGRDRSTLSVTDVVSSEAGIGVTILVPGADAPWSCLADNQGKGKVQGVMYTGKEGG